ncbi:unnamed protein product, partial [Musa acuminata subsp. burmannicoides]
IFSVSRSDLPQYVSGPLFYDEKRKKVFDLERAERPRSLWSQPRLRWKESATEPLSPDEKQGAVQRPSLLPSRMEEGEQISTVRAPFSFFDLAERRRVEPLSFLDSTAGQSLLESRNLSPFPRLRPPLFHNGRRTPAAERIGFRSLLQRRRRRPDSGIDVFLMFLLSSLFCSF